MVTTPARAVRVDEATWAAALKKAESEGVSLSEVIRRALIEYIRP